MNYEYFKTNRDFKKKFPSGIYKCCQCNRITTNPYICIQCGKQANILFGDIYKFKIGENPPETIFKPIELGK